MKIPFSVKYRTQIESGEYKVIDKNGRNVRIICWDMKSPKKYGYHLVGLVEFSPNNEESTYYTLDGKARLRDKEPCLFIVTPEPELTEFESTFGRAMMEVPKPEEKEKWYQFLKEKAAELLDLAREQFIKDGYIIEKKAFYGAVEKVDPEVMKEVSDKVDIEETLRLEYEKGRADALKEIEQDPESSYAFKRGVEYGKEEALEYLPRWKKANTDMHVIRGCLINWNGEINTSNFIPKDSYYIPIIELEYLLKKE